MRTKLALILCFGLFHGCVNASWHILLSDLRQWMNPKTVEILSRQYDECAAKALRPIAHPDIVAIPIQESHEQLINVVEMQHPRIHVMYDAMLLKAHQMPQDIDPRSARHMFVRSGVWNCLERMLEELDKLASLCGACPGDFELYIFEGLRDLTTQKELFDRKYAELQIRYPAMSDQELYAETSRWVSPYINNVPAHATGGALDFHIFNARIGSFLDMCRFNVGGSAAITMADDVVSFEQRFNRGVMLVAATNAGFVNYAQEFWHYSYGDRYWAYWHRMPYAIYGAL